MLPLDVLPVLEVLVSLVIGLAALGAHQIENSHRDDEASYDVTHGSKVKHLD